MRYCCVPGCPNKEQRPGSLSHIRCKDAGITFHSFPKINPERCAQWARAIRNDGWRPLKHSHVCSEHFEEKYFDRNDFRVRLRYGAVPTLGIPLTEKRKQTANSNPNMTNNLELDDAESIDDPDEIIEDHSEQLNSKPEKCLFSDHLELPSSAALTSMVMDHPIDGSQTLTALNFVRINPLDEPSAIDPLALPSSSALTSMVMQFQPGHPLDGPRASMDFKVEDIEINSKYIKDEPLEDSFQSPADFNESSPSPQQLHHHQVKFEGDVFSKDELSFDEEEHHKILFYLEMCDGRKLRLILSSPEAKTALQGNTCCDAEDLKLPIGRLLNIIERPSL